MVSATGSALVSRGEILGEDGRDDDDESLGEGMDENRGSDDDNFGILAPPTTLPIAPTTGTLLLLLLLLLLDIIDGEYMLPVIT